MCCNGGTDSNANCDPLAERLGILEEFNFDAFLNGPLADPFAGAWEPQDFLPLNIYPPPAVVPAVAPAANDGQPPAFYRLNGLNRYLGYDAARLLDVVPDLAALGQPGLLPNLPALPPAPKAQPVRHHHGLQIKEQPPVQPAQPVARPPPRQNRQDLVVRPAVVAARPNVPARPQAVARPGLAAGALAAPRILKAQNNQRGNNAARAAAPAAAGHEAQVQQRHMQKQQEHQEKAKQRAEHMKRLQQGRPNLMKAEGDIFSQALKRVMEGQPGPAMMVRPWPQFGAAIDAGLALPAQPQHRAAAVNMARPPRAGNVAAPAPPQPARAAPVRVQQHPHHPHPVLAYGNRGVQYGNRGAGAGRLGGPAGL